MPLLARSHRNMISRASRKSSQLSSRAMSLSRLASQSRVPGPLRHSSVVAVSPDAFLLALRAASASLFAYQSKRTWRPNMPTILSGLSPENSSS